jgi:hypothetical protein
MTSRQILDSVDESLAWAAASLPVNSTARAGYHTDEELAAGAARGGFLKKSKTEAAPAA